MFERFTKRGRQAITLAHDEAKRLGHNFLGTEHLLLGLLAEGGGVAGTVLNRRGLTLESARARVRAMIGTGPGGGDDDVEALASIGIDLASIRAATDEAFGAGALDRAMLVTGNSLGRLKFTPRAKKVLELTLREALSLGHNYLGTEHLLLALVREGNGVAARILADTVGPLEHLRAAVLEELASRVS